MKYVISILLVFWLFNCDNTVSIDNPVDPTDTVYVDTTTVRIIVDMVGLPVDQYGLGLFIRKGVTPICTVSTYTIDTIDLPDKYLYFSWMYNSTEVLLSVKPEKGTTYRLYGITLLKY